MRSVIAIERFRFSAMLAATAVLGMILHFRRSFDDFEVIIFVTFISLYAALGFVSVYLTIKNGISSAYRTIAVFSTLALVSLFVFSQTNIGYLVASALSVIAVGLLHMKGERA